ncbi:TPA: PKD domain-containing protein, partial [Candidatus Poribacteria bacterium]|nr:PKD domain-containing protein [Candidatus Poribacteria bacterium]
MNFTKESAPTSSYFNPPWELHEWSRRLFDSVFKITEKSPSHDPVARINIKDPNLWKQVLDDESDDIEADSIQSAFLRACVKDRPQRQSANWFREEMQKGAEKIGILKDPINNFWLLTISLLAATAAEEDLNIGEYRRRLKGMLKLDREQNFGLIHLPTMWEQLVRRTLELAMKSESSYRILELTDPGRETRIGYSKKLAFPVQKDLEKFVEVVEESSALQEGQNQFKLVRALLDGPNFTEAFNRAIEKFQMNLYNSNLYQDPIWVTYLDILRRDYPHASSGLACVQAEPTVREIDLIMYPGHAIEYDLEFSIASRLTVEALASQSDQAAVMWRKRAGAYKADFVMDQSLLLHWFDIVDPTNSPLKATMASFPKHFEDCHDDGIFVFQKSEEGEWVADRRCNQNSGTVYLLAYQSVAGHLEKVAGSSGGVKRLEIENDPDNPKIPPYFKLLKIDVSAVVACLKNKSGPKKSRENIAGWLPWNVTRPRIRPKDLFKQANGAFVSPAMPLRIRRDNWTKCTAVSMDEATPQVDADLELERKPSSNEEDFFVLRLEGNDQLKEGQKIQIQANDDEAGHVDQRAIVVVTRCLDPQFKKPSDPAQYLEEKTQGQLGPAGQEDLVSFVTENSEFSGDKIPTFKPIGQSKDEQGQACLSLWQTLDHYSGPYDALLESIAVAATYRKDLRYSDLMTWIENVYPGCKYEIFASLRDNGFIQEWQPKKHCMPIYWVPTPYLVHVKENDFRVIGIVPANQRFRLTQLCEQNSVEPLVAKIEKSGVLGAIGLKGASPEFLGDLRNTFGWELSVLEPRPLSSPEEVLTISLAGRHQTDNPKKCAIWKGGRRWDEKNRDRNDLPQLNLQRNEDHNRPKRYVVHASEIVRWATRSESWAILIMASLEEKQLFSLRSSGDLCRNEKDGYAFGARLPEPVGRYALFYGNGVSGPIHQDKGNTYVHCFGDVTRAIDCCEDWVAFGELESSPAVSLNIDPLSGEYPLEIHCSGQSSGKVKKWSWDFGDGSSATDQNPTHTYTSAGEYVIRLTVLCRGGEGSDQRKISVVEPVPQACFDMDPITGPYPLTVQFSDLSTGLVETRKWKFGDGHSSGEKAPSHTFDQPGDYRISFKVMGPGGSSVIENLLEVKEHSPSVHFKASTLSGVAPLKVQFQQTTFGKVDSCEWDFGDGCHSNEANPLHVYANPGAFIVRLEVNGPGGRHEYTYPNPITVAEFAERPNVELSPKEGKAPLTVTISHDFSEPITEIQWSFGDGEWVEYEV